ncbi:STAS domain-containing protein [Nonomuraea guangzhouensis]|uniref:STAS domain-containing protein n=1 Tax=Nonomuraea guangzhouensis TaxID=1291555 RepID=A0ABW4GUC3_9ACTN|nr:STAS domain-containing protein [Nonomuraea guangzhouensis]
MTTLRLSCWRLPRIAVIVVDGDLDASNDEQLRGNIEQSQPDDHVVFDMSTLSHLDSCGLWALLDTYTTAAPHGGVYVAAAATGPSRILQITGVSDRVPTDATVEQALQAALTAIAARSG